MCRGRSPCKMLAPDRAKCTPLSNLHTHFAHGFCSKRLTPHVEVLRSWDRNPTTPMPFAVSKEKDWRLNQFVMVPISLVMCSHISQNSKLILIFLMNQINYNTASLGTMDQAVNVHRTTRTRCLVELRELGFIKGNDQHIILCDPIPILTKLKKQKRSTEQELDEIIDRSDDTGSQLKVVPVTVVQRDYMQDASDSWNRYRPKDYQKIRRISSQLVKSVDTHMRELGVQAHDYDQFFSILKAGVERSPFWSKANTNKTLQSITGIGNPTDTKKGNVYALFNDGIEAPSASVSEEERVDTVIYPAAYRKVIDEYDAAQTSYSQAYFDRQPLDDVAEYVVRTETDLWAVGLDPAKFRYKYGISKWPTATPEPENTRIVNWTYDDEYGHVC